MRPYHNIFDEWKGVMVILDESSAGAVTNANIGGIIYIYIYITIRKSMLLHYI